MMRPDLVTTPSMPEPRQLRFSVDDFYKMIEMGMIDDYEQSEIIDGRMVKKMTIGDRHGFVVDMLAEFFFSLSLANVRIRIQNPLRVDDFDEPEPDIVLADLTKYDGRRHPTPAETILVIEVADASLKYDRDTKLALYASAEIPEVWIVNLPNDLIEVHHQPAAGIYQRADIFRSGDTLRSSVLPELSLAVSDILV
ncbi:MAG: Uma2 family endonuclease [Pyrinomonadaceae bacterium]